MDKPLCVTATPNIRAITFEVWQDDHSDCNSRTFTQAIEAPARFNTRCKDVFPQKASAVGVLAVYLRNGCFLARTNSAFTLAHFCAQAAELMKVTSLPSL